MGRETHMAHAPNNAPHHTQALASLRAALDALPSTPDGIAIALRSLGLHGQRHSTTRYPLAAYACRIPAAPGCRHCPVPPARPPFVATCQAGPPTTLPLPPAA